MKHAKSIPVILSLILLAAAAFAQDKRTGTVKGKVKVETGSAGGVSVIVRQGEREITRGLTGKNGEFAISRLSPGRYGLTFRKSGLSVGTIEDVEVKAGKTRSLNNLFLPIDEGSIAFLRGSVFNENDRSVPNVRIELAKIEEDGTARKIDGRITNEIGAFVFRLSPETAKYRVTVRPPNGADPVSKDIEIDGAAVYRLALSIKPTPK